VAAEVAASVETDPRIATVDIAGPGFLNITVTDAAWPRPVERCVPTTDSASPPADPRKVIVDHGGPNVAKSLHVGHLRPAIIGQAIKRVFAFAGHEALGDVHLGDWGTPMGQLIAELELRNPDWPYFDPITRPLRRRTPRSPSTNWRSSTRPPPSGRRTTRSSPTRPAGDLRTAGRAAGYRALWAHFRQVSVEAMREIYDELGVHFDLWLGEASVHDRIAPMIER
jgi:arginyl-tRNA synthetase